jgi:alanyl-tRNA synthetase
MNKAEGIIEHTGKFSEGSPFAAADAVTLAVHAETRKANARMHSASH